MSDELAPRPSKTLGPSTEIIPDDPVSSFFNADDAGIALRMKGFTVQEELENLIEIARHTAKDETRLSAYKQLSRRLREIAEVSGKITSVSQTKETVDAEGNRIRQVASTNRLVDRIRRGAEARSHERAIPTYYPARFDDPLAAPSSGERRGDESDQPAGDVRNPLPERHDSGPDGSGGSQHPPEPGSP